MISLPASAQNVEKFGEARLRRGSGARTLSVGIRGEDSGCSVDRSVFSKTLETYDCCGNYRMPSPMVTCPVQMLESNERASHEQAAHASRSGTAQRLRLAPMGANSSASVTPQIAPDQPGISDLFAVLAYGEISAFYRLVEEAQLSPSLRGKVAVAKMAASEMNHFTTLERALSERDVDVFDAMAPYVRALDAYHASTNPSTWLESMVKFYVGDGIAADFYREIAGALPPEIADVVRDVLAETGHSEFVVDEVRSAVAANRQEKDRLTLWGRRLLGEAITQAQFVMAQREELADLLITATGTLNGIVALFDRMQESHSQRMQVLGLM